MSLWAQIAVLSYLPKLRMASRRIQSRSVGAWAKLALLLVFVFQAIDRSSGTCSFFDAQLHACMQMHVTQHSID